MSQQKELLNYNSFSGGIITEASPLTFPDGASLDEANFELTKQGYRKRRKGLDYFSDKLTISSTDIAPKDILSYTWEDVGGSGSTYMVIGITDELYIYNITNDTVGDKLVYSTIIDNGSVLGVTAHGGTLIVATGTADLVYIKALGGNIFTESTERLTIRDLTGIPDFVNGDNIDVEKADYRPTASEMWYEIPESPSYDLDIDDDDDSTDDDNDDSHNDDDAFDDWGDEWDDDDDDDDSGDDDAFDDDDDSDDTFHDDWGDEEDDDDGSGWV